MKTICSVLFIGFLLLPNTSKAEFQVGGSYSFDVFDFGTELLTGRSASGRNLGLNVGYFFNPWGVELFLGKASVKKGIEVENTFYSFAMDDFYWGVGGKKTFFFNFFYIRFGISFHQLTSTINDSDEIFDDVSDEILTPSTGGYMAPYIGTGFDYTILVNYKIYTEASFYKFSQTTMYEWDFGLRYSF